MPLMFVQQDITAMNVDAIVNAANEKLKNFARRRGGGVCGAIFRAAGQNQMQKACDQIGGCETGDAVITPGFALPAKHVIHAVGPVYKTGGMDEALQLYACYGAALRLAEEIKARTIAFPLISSGIFGYPPYEALRIAVTAIENHLCSRSHYTPPVEPMDVYLSLLDDELFQLANAKRDELEWPEISSAYSKKMLEERRAADRFEFVKKKSPFTEEQIRKMESLPFEEAVAYRNSLIHSK